MRGIYKHSAMTSICFGKGLHRLETQLYKLVELFSTKYMLCKDVTFLVF